MASQETTNSDQQAHPSPTIEQTSPPSQQASQETPTQKSTTPPSQEEEPTAQPNPRLAALSTKKTHLEAHLLTLRTEKATLIQTTPLPSGLSMPTTWTDEEKATSAITTANATIKEHIALLHKYNEIKDIAQGLMGMIAEGRGVRVREVMEGFGVGERD